MHSRLRDLDTPTSTKCLTASCSLGNRGRTVKFNLVLLWRQGPDSASSGHTQPNRSLSIGFLPLAAVTVHLLQESVSQSLSLDSHRTMIANSAD